MPSAWKFALKAIPWATLLSNAPAIARAAEALLSGTRPHRGPAAPPDQMRNLTERIDALEAHDRAHAELLKQITDQVEALTTATEVLGARQRWLLVIGIVSLGVAILALVLAL
jgi:hypothetical protein